MSRRKWMKIGLLSALGITVAGAVGLGYVFDVESEMIEIVPLELTLPRLHGAFDGFRLVQISDIHMGTGMTPHRLLHIVQMVNQQQPDVIAITGDFVTHGSASRHASGLVAALSQLRAKEKIVAVLGNHDHWTDAAAIRQIIRQSGLFDISNSVYSLRRGEGILHFAGVDDHWYGKDRLDEVLNKLLDDGAAILLAHEPDYADISAPTGRFDLQISGHTHGGQIILPFMNRPLVLPRHGHKYPLGRYQVGQMIQYTNRGVGTILPAVRFNCRPEITVFTLRALTA